MSFSAIKKIQRVIRDVLFIPEHKIKAGRANSVYNYSNEFYLVDVDNVEQMAQGKRYDDNTDEDVYTVHFSAVATVTFMGPSCEDMANKFVTVVQSDDRSYWSMQDERVTLLRVRSYEYIKKQYNGQWWPVIVVTLNCNYAFEHRRRSNYFEDVPIKYLDNK
tara:strand:- start:644 stop:1129 length:486 start_codon:yes stop_codon:yes gene_type:complete